MFEKLFTPGKIGNLEIKNRFIVPPMLSEYATEDGRLTERYIRYYEEKAKGGFGLIICEDNSIEPAGSGFKHLAGLWADEMMTEHKELTKRVKAQGAKIAVQIYHAGRESNSAILGLRPVAPSAIQDPTSGEVPRELTTQEVKDMVEKFAQAARRCKEAGYDAIEFHGAHGYLINQFVSPFSNKRTDEYGGTFMNRLRFPLEIIKRTKELVGDDYPIIYRISADELIDGGLSIVDTKMIAPILEEAGIAALHVSAAVYKSGQWPSAPTSAPTTPFIKYAEEMKKVVNIPVIGVNKIYSPEIAEAILREGKADFVSMGRASIADPYLPNKVKENRLDEIVYCVGCWQGCQGMIAKQLPVTCLVNPMVGKEELYKIVPAKEKKKVMVVGGGPAGMQAAIVAAKRGHEVHLYEKTDKLGGQWLLAAVPPGKEQLNTFTVWQKSELKRQSVKVVMGTEVTNQVICDIDPDHIIIATGANPFIPPIKGIDGKNVVQANEILEGKKPMGNVVAVIGGGLVGAETAEHIAMHNRQVTIVEMAPVIVSNLESAPKTFLLKHLDDTDTKILVNTKVLEIKEDGVVIEKEGEKEEIPCDQVVIAIGSRPNKDLEELIKAKYSYKVIGDATKVGRALEAVEMGHVAGMEI